jgi:alginate O-acetyltransferase complex protein AlgI
MLFLTYWFVFFAAGAFAAYWLVRHHIVRLALLLVCCVVFHTQFAGPAGVFPIVVLGVVCYFAGLTRNRWVCIGGMLLSALALIFYKYAHFLCIDLLESLWPGAGTQSLQLINPLLPEAPPLAISFFVFEFIHYLFDVSTGSEPIRNPADFTLFALFWPSIVAGPVKRYQQFLPAVHRGAREVNRHDVAYGLALLGFGLFKKLIADNLATYIAAKSPYFCEVGCERRWELIVAIGLRILLDFSGYSDMAIGCARMFGIALPRNFNWPYLATSIGDFWHRWHISLSLWIRDYIYIPIGGSRHGPARKAVNGVLAFAICGLWHGAAWNFLVWGLYHGLGLAVQANYKQVLGRPGAMIANVLGRYRIAAWGLTLIYVNVGWLFFFYPLPTALQMATTLMTRR